ncbi:Protein of unknown function [Amycolatopsis marina]|uniref:DUF998 domain-containing protein n=1 Tax=Amycolatopsis marina TaxID=490629 RepID=A0A1I0Z3Z2_9PSEU|nr:DUF998 domain-containing protein [Amycolatopsis marina]SFB20082.1 Protein of unknown function [Amycolatopsis marina]
MPSSPALETRTADRGTPPLPLIALAALACGVVLMGLLQFLPPTSEISPIRRTISEYALSENKWLFDLSVALIAAGSAIAIVLLVRHRLLRPVSLAFPLFAAWVLGLVMIVIFPKTDWSVGPSLGGSIHRVASLMAFLCLPIAIMLAARAVFAHAPRWRRATQALGAAALLWFTPILVAVLVMAAGGPPWWRSIPLGLVERGLALTEVLAVAALALGLHLRPAPTGRTLAIPPRT